MKKGSTTKKAAAPKQTKTTDAPAAGKGKMSDLLRAKREANHPGKNWRKGDPDAPAIAAPKTGRAVHQKVTMETVRATGEPVLCGRKGESTDIDADVTCGNCIAFREKAKAANKWKPEPEVTPAPAVIETEPLKPEIVVTGGEEAEGRQAQRKVEGISIAALCRWMGRVGFTEKQAIAALEGVGITGVSRPGVRGSLGMGRPDSPRYEKAKIPEVPVLLDGFLRKYLDKAAA